MTTTHTPGPWRAVMELGFPAIIASNDRRVADIICPLEIRKTEEGQQELGANARLIAAAPELLEALKCWVDHEGKSCFVLGVDGWCEDCARCITRKAIAKAEGKGRAS